MESGGTRNYEVWHDEKKTNEEFAQQLEEDEKMDSMKALENRVAESQREMAEQDALEEIRAMNQRHVSLMKGGKRMDAAEAVLKAREAAMGVPPDEENLNEFGLTNEEEDLVKSIKFGASNNISGGENGDDDASSSIRRLDEEDELLAEKRRKEEAEAMMIKQQNAAKEKESEQRSKMPVFKVKRKKKRDATATAPEPKRAKADAIKEPHKKTQGKDDASGTDSNDGGGGALGGLLCYGSDSD